MGACRAHERARPAGRRARERPRRRGLRRRGRREDHGRFGRGAGSRSGRVQLERLWQLPHLRTGRVERQGVGPPLDRFGPDDAGAVRAAIISPPAGTIMPEDFGTRIEPADLDALVEFIAS